MKWLTIAILAISAVALVLLFWHTLLHIPSFAYWSPPPKKAPLAADVPCLTSFTIYDSKVFFGLSPIAPADPSTFVALPTSNCVSYGKDRNHVYIGYLGENGPTFSIVPNAAPSSFTPYYDVSGLIVYSKDNDHVFRTDATYGLATNTEVGIEQLSEDPKSFSVLYDEDGYFTGYAKDQNHVYWYENAMPINGADPTTFEVLEGIWIRAGSNEKSETGLAFARDANDVYFAGQRISGVNVATFTPLYTAAGFWTPYARDDTKVFCENADDELIVLKSAIPASFEPEETSDGGFSGYSHDQLKRWQRCTAQNT